MKTLIVVDAQNKSSSEGRRPIPNHAQALEAIHRRVEEACRDGRPIAWVRHHNPPEESAAPSACARGSWGAEFSPGLGPLPARKEEAKFLKEVYGAFTGTSIGSWLWARGSARV